LEEIVAAPVKKTETTTGGIRCADHATLSVRKIWHYFANKRRSLGRHSSLADQSHGGFFYILPMPGLPSTVPDLHTCVTLHKYCASISLFLFRSVTASETQFLFVTSIYGSASCLVHSYRVSIAALCFSVIYPCALKSLGQILLG
jgi:hypothetical protein